MRKPGLLAFIIACLVVCLIPSVGMFFWPNTQVIGNEKVTMVPGLTKEDGSFNEDVLSELGAYFEQHFAFRPEIITADADIQSTIFGVSNVDSVVSGTDGWLYYSSTLDDYLGRNALSERQINGIVHNLALVQQRVNEHGAKFLFTVSPNKNTLYPEHMPSYYRPDASAPRNRDLLNRALAKSTVDYCNLFSVFQSRDETLYFARDSHWNNKGALLAYDAMLDKLGKAHDDYADKDVTVKEDFVGDLNKMMYPASDKSEQNYYYDAEGTYRYATETSSVEDPLIKTVNDDGEGSLFMYRDSFGNLLLPFFGSAYKDATFSKAFPIMLDFALTQYDPDDVIFEIAERNIPWFLTQPPMMEAPVMDADASAIDLSSKTKYELTVRESEVSPMYLEVVGSTDGLGDASTAYLYVRDGHGSATLYECYNLLTQEQEDAFLAYLDAGAYEDSSTLSISVVTRDSSGFKAVGSNNVRIKRDSGDEGNDD